jgi:hypothetical protein
MHQRLTLDDAFDPARDGANVHTSHPGAQLPALVRVIGSAAPRKRSRNGPSLVRLVVLLYLAVATYPLRFASVSSGLDPSWVYAINYLPSTSYVWGRDFIYTYGPLGYLFFPQAVDGHLEQAAVYWSVFHLVFSVTLVYLGLKAATSVQVVGFAALFLLAKLCALTADDLSTVLSALLLWTALQNKRLRLMCLAATGVFTAVFLFQKFSVGLSSGMLLTTALCVIVVEGRHAWRQIILNVLAASAGFGVTIGILTARELRGLDGLMDWLRLSFLLVEGYDVGTSLYQPEGALALGLVSLSLLGVLAALTLRWRSRLAVFLAMAAAPTFEAFKHSYVRQDAHLVLFVTYMLAVAGLCILFSPGAREVRTSLMVGFGVLIVSLPIAAPYLPGRQALVDGLFARQGLRALTSALDLQPARAQLQAGMASQFENSRLPADWIALIHAQPDATVDIVPWDIVRIGASGLTWNPSPVLQSFVAYSAALDQRNAEHFNSPNSPDFLVAQYLDIDGRVPLVASPGTWRAIFANYELVEKARDTASGETGLFRRRQYPLDQREAPLYTETVDLKDWVAVPQSNHLLLAHIDTHFTPLGAFVKTLYRVDPLYLQVRYFPGVVEQSRFLPDNARNGMVVNFLPRTLAEFTALQTGQASGQVRMFRLIGPGADSVDTRATITWAELPQLVTDQAATSPCTVAYSGGWYHFEASGGAGYRWTSGDGGLLIDVPEPREARLTGRIQSIPRPNSVEVLVNGQAVGSILDDWEGARPFPSITLPLREGLNQVVFHSTAAPVSMPDDARPLTISVTGLELDYPTFNATCPVAP